MMRVGNVIAAAGFAAALLGGCGGSTTAAPTAAPVSYVAKLKVEARKLLVNGTSTSLINLVNGSWIDSVDAIDRALTLHFKIPENPGFPGALWGADVDNSTCNRTWKCAAQDFKLCPGMSVATANVRVFGPTPKNRDAYASNVKGDAPAGFAKPTISWIATKGKFYTLLFVHLVSPSLRSTLKDATGNTITWFFHAAYHNVPMNDLKQGYESPNGWVAPGTPTLPRESYTFLLFEYDAKLSQTDIDAAQASLSAGTVGVEFKDYVKALKLKSSQLVSANWMSAKGSPSSFFNAVIGGFAPGDFKKECETMTKGKPATGVLDMCEALDTSCSDYGGHEFFLAQV